MARNPYGDHSTVVTGTNDATKQVSKDAWNAGHDQAGMMGFTAANKTIATGALTPVDTLNIVAGEGALADDLDFITYGAANDVADKDFVILISGSQTITVKHNTGSPPANSGAIILKSGASKILSTTEILVLQRIGNTFYEQVGNFRFADGAVVIYDNNGNEVLRVGLTASAVNDITVKNSATGNNPIIQPSGDDANLGVNLKIKGTGKHTIENSHIDIGGILGLPTTEITIATGALAATVSPIIVDSEGAGTSDTLDTVTGLVDGDMVALYAKAGETITVTHDLGGTDSIHLRHKINIFLSEKVPLVLVRKASEWYELSAPEITKMELALGKPSDSLATGDNQANNIMDMKGKLIKVKANVDTVSSSGTPTFAIRKNTLDMLSTNITIDANEASSETAATPPVIKSDGTEVALKDDVIRVDCDVAGTGTKGAIITLWFENLSDE